MGIVHKENLTSTAVRPKASGLKNNLEWDLVF